MVEELEMTMDDNIIPYNEDGGEEQVMTRSGTPSEFRTRPASTASYYDRPRYRIGGEQFKPHKPWGAMIASSTAPIPASWQKTNKDVVGITSQRKLLRQRKQASIPHPSYDLDGDGAVSNQDLFISRRFDRSDKGYLTAEEQQEAKRAMAEGLNDQTLNLSLSGDPSDPSFRTTKGIPRTSQSLTSPGVGPLLIMDVIERDKDQDSFDGRLTDVTNRTLQRTMTSNGDLVSTRSELLETRRQVAMEGGNNVKEEWDKANPYFIELTYKKDDKYYKEQPRWRTRSELLTARKMVHRQEAITLGGQGGRNGNDGSVGVSVSGGAQTDRAHSSASWVVYPTPSTATTTPQNRPLPRPLTSRRHSRHNLSRPASTQAWYDRSGMSHGVMQETIVTSLTATQSQTVRDRSERRDHLSLQWVEHPTTTTRSALLTQRKEENAVEREEIQAAIEAGQYVPAEQRAALREEEEIAQNFNVGGESPLPAQSLEAVIVEVAPVYFGDKEQLFSSYRTTRQSSSTTGEDAEEEEGRGGQRVRRPYRSTSAQPGSRSSRSKGDNFTFHKITERPGTSAGGVKKEREKLSETSRQRRSLTEKITTDRSHSRLFPPEAPIPLRRMQRPPSRPMSGPLVELSMQRREPPRPTFLHPAPRTTEGQRSMGGQSLTPRLLLHAKPAGHANGSNGFNPTTNTNPNTTANTNTNTNRDALSIVGASAPRTVHHSGKKKPPVAPRPPRMIKTGGFHRIHL
jgi:hypothetical protein